MNEVFGKCISVQAHEEGGADWFPYGHQISPKTLLKQIYSLNLEIDHIANCGDSAAMFAFGMNDEGETVYWAFFLPSWMKSKKWLDALGWFRPLVEG